MTKKTFVESKEVRILTDYLVHHWHQDFDFKLSLYKKGRRSLDFRSISSIREALEHYYWEYSIKTDHPLPDGVFKSGYAFQQSANLLDYSRDKILNKGSLNTDTDIRTGMELVLRWGGVYKKGNKAFVEQAGTDMKRYVDTVRNTWSDINSSGNLQEFIAHTGNDFIFNSGITKLYAVMLNDFIIYDSRVSVALAFLMEQCFGSNIPEVLKLYIPPSQVVDKTKRAVSSCFDTGTYKPHKKHFISNVKASWLLQEVSKKLNDHTSVRAIEAALFMIGYDVRPKEKKR